MLRIALVDDDEKDQDCVRDLAVRYFGGDGGALRFSRFHDGEDFLEDYRHAYDLVFLDIEMERMDGLECARRLREVDREVLLVFTTNMAQYAASGYDVDALGYLVKPLRYYNFALAMRRVEEALDRRRGRVLWLSAKDGDAKVAVASRDLLFVEVRKHELSFHTTDGTYVAWGSLKECAGELEGLGFYQCNRYYLVNLAHVRFLKGSNLVMDSGDELAVSRRSRRGLLEALDNYYGSR